MNATGTALPFSVPDPAKAELVGLQHLERIKALNAALAKAQGSFPSIPRSRSVTVQTKSGGTYDYDYAPLEAIMPAIRSALAENGLAVVQLLEAGPSLRTELRHAEGGVISASFPFKGQDSPQALGSAITYIRRYALVAMLGLVTEHDDDAAAAEDGAGPTTAQDDESISEAQHRKIGALIRELSELSPKAEGQLSYEQDVRNLIGKRSRRDFTKAEASRAIEKLEEWKHDAEIPFA